jgi:hypothetical protein
VRYYAFAILLLTKQVNESERKNCYFVRTLTVQMSLLVRVSHGVLVLNRITAE